MTLVVETGALVAGANTYVSVADVRDYALLRGTTLSDADVTLEAHIIKATDYLEALRGDFKGSKVSPTQALQWPRYPVSIDGTLIDSTVIPNELKQAQMQLVMALDAGIDIAPTSLNTSVITREKVGQLETEYSSTQIPSGVPTLRQVNNLLAPLLEGQGTLRVVRG